MTQKVDALNQTTSYTYNANGDVLTRTDPTGTITYTYNGFGQMLTETDPLGHAMSSVYNLMSRMTARTDAAGQTTNYDYDDYNRLIKTTYPAATAGATRLFETVTYDLAGNVKTRTDTAGRATVYDYDTAQRLLKTTDAAAQITNYGYNGRSQLVSVTDAASQIYTFAYDPLGRVLSQTRAGTTMSYAYDAVGSRTQRTDYNGAVTNYSYDALNRLTTISYPDATTATYGYDALSRLATATNQNGAVSMAYDNRSRVQSVTDVWGQAVAYGYDANSNRTTLQLGATPNATYTYDTDNRLTNLTDNTGGAFTFGYDATNKMTTRTMPNGVGVSYSYDGMNRLTQMGYVAGTNTLASFAYGYNTASQITGVTEPSNTRGYAYDNVDRLTGATYTNGQTPETYAYNGVGNRTSSHLSATYTHAPYNKLTATATATYTYNNNGNMTAKTDTAGSWAYTWDYENRLTKVVKSGGLTVNYKYDALGRRIQRAPSTGISTNFTYDGADVVLDANSDGSTVSYVNGPGIDNKLKLNSSVSGAKYFVSDHLGSTRALTNASGAVTESVAYDSFGNATAALSTRYGYTGRELDSDTGLYYYRNRWYDPQTGRFASEDPIGFGGGENWYAYVENNPQMTTDPMGEDGIPGQRIPRRNRRGRGPVFGGGILPRGPVPNIDPPGGTPHSRPWSYSTPPLFPQIPTPMMPEEDCACLDIPRAPDFFTLSGTVGGFYGVGLDLTADRHGGVYVGVHVSGGGPIVTGASFTGGWLSDTCTPTPRELDNFLAGEGGSVTGFYGLGGGVQGSKGNDRLAILLGAGTPGYSASAGKSYHLARFMPLQ